jgi:hypothetical protein
MQHESLYIDSRNAPLNRLKSCVNGVEHHFTEAAVMVAFAMYLLGQDATNVRICPDGEHAKRHDLKTTLERYGFALVKPSGTTSYGGTYRRQENYLIVDPSSGKGDVTARLDGRIVFAECKGGIINTKHAGQTSRLRKGLCEAIGQLMSRELGNERHIAVVPDTPTTRMLAKRLCTRAGQACIEIALIDANGLVHLPNRE